MTEKGDFYKEEAAVYSACWVGGPGNYLSILKGDVNVIWELLIQSSVLICS